MNDTHAIPAHDAEDGDLCANESCGACAPVPAEPTTEAEINPGDILADTDDDEWVAVSTGRETFLVGPTFLHTTKEVIEKFGPLIKYDLTEGELTPGTDAAAALTRLGDAYAPAKTHDLTVRHPDGNAMVVVEDEEDEYRLHIPGPDAEILGQILKILTPAQVAILADALTGGAL